jgi:signal transduction histidine kinase
MKLLSEAAPLRALRCLAATWFCLVAAPPLLSLELNPAERDYLAALPPLRLAPDPNFGPIEWFNQEGEYQGFSSEYVALLAQHLGIEFEIVQGRNWQDILDKVRRGEVDAVSAVIATPERRRYLAFTRPYLEMQRAIFATRDLPGVGSLDDLAGYRVAVVEGSWMDETLSRREGVSLNRFQDLATALNATSRGVTDLTGSALETMAFTRIREGLTNLRPVATLPDRMQLSFGLHPDLAPLVPLMDRALAAVTPEEAARIEARWLDIEEPRFWQTPKFIFWLSIATTFAMVAMILVLSWNRLLNARVRERSEQLQQAHTRLMRAEKMETMGQLAAGIAHEVKNPLAIIQMGADYLAGALADNADQQAVVRDMGDAVARADAVINGLLDYSHHDELTLTPQDPEPVLQEALRLVGHELRQRNIRCSLAVEAGTPPVAMDVNRIKQVLINALVNAAQAMGRDGSLDIACAPIPGGLVRIRIVDTGPGIDEALLEKIFDPFFTTKAVGEGTGLGLSVSRNIVELHHGKLAIGNRPGGGAELTIDLRTAAEEA